MSLNSLQDDMSRRAASMAAMAKRANNPQEIEAIQKNLVAGVQNGSIQPYVGIPLIQELTQKLTAAKAQMAQTMAGAGMQQSPQGQQVPQQPIAQRVMQQATQESQGLEALPSNLPQEYAGGGIIAFEGGGEVERYQNQGFTGDPMGMGGSEITDYAGTADPYVGKNILETITFAPDDPEWKRKLKLEEALRERQKALKTTPPVVKPPPTPAAVPPAPPAVAEKRPAAPTVPATTTGGGGGFKMPTLAGMDKIEAPTLENITDLVKGLPTKAKTAFDDAVKAAKTELEGFDKPGFDTREGRLGKRELAQEKDSAINRALNVMNLGFGIAGSKERTLAGALGKEGREGIVDLIKGEAANRAAKDRLEDMRDNLEQQKIAAKKGNYQAAQTAGREASRDLQAATQLTMTGAHYGNTEALQRYQVQNQSSFQRASLDQSSALGLAGLDLQNRQLAQQGALGRANLAMQEKRFAAMDATAQARIKQVQASAFKDFTKEVAPQLNAQFIKEYGPNWRTAQDARSLQAQMLFKQQQDNYLSQAMGLAMDTLGARSADALLMGQ